MSIISAIIGSSVGSLPEPISSKWFLMNSDDPDRGYNNTTDWWYSSLTGGGPYINSVLSAPPPTWTSYTYPDGSNGHVYEFDGVNKYLFSPNLAQASSWPNNSITIDYWFYPTSNGIQLLSECNSSEFVYLTYHYSVLEINNTNNIYAKFWDGPYLTSSNEVTLNQWNHIYFTENIQGDHDFKLNGIPTYNNPNYIRTKPTNPFSLGDDEYFVIGYNDVTNMGNTNRFQGKVGLLKITNSVVVSTFGSTKTKFGL